MVKYACMGLTVADALSGKSKCRNKTLAEAFQYMNLIEGWGTGLPRLFESCAEMGLPQPKFEEFGDGIKVTIYRAIGAKEANAEFNEANNETNRSNGEANETIQDMIIAIIREESTVSQRAIAEKIGIARSTVQRHMAQMEANGLLKRKGSTRGTWEIQER